MKRCPKCGQTYNDRNINFCLNDGELLSLSDSAYRSPFDEPPKHNADDSPPTMVLDQARITNPIGWNQSASPPAMWQQAQPQQVYPFTVRSSPNIILGIVSLLTGVASLTVGWCCYVGLLLAPLAIVTGIIALIQHKSDPEKYGGQILAIGGIVTGILAVFAWIIFIAFILLAN